jgi:hypothetical protein
MVVVVSHQMIFCLALLRTEFVQKLVVVGVCLRRRMNVK